MAKETIIAKYTHEGAVYAQKASVQMYDTSSKMDGQLVEDANVGLTLRAQRAIRESIKSKHGLKKVSAGGKEVDMSAIENADIDV